MLDVQWTMSVLCKGINCQHHLWHGDRPINIKQVAEALLLRGPNFSSLGLTCIHWCWLHISIQTQRDDSTNEDWMTILSRALLKWRTLSQWCWRVHLFILWFQSLNQEGWRGKRDKSKENAWLKTWPSTLCLCWPLHLFPPNKRVLLQHMRRVNFQVCIWKRAHKHYLEIPFLINHGLHIEPKWFEGDVIPKGLIDVLAEEVDKEESADEHHTNIYIIFKNGKAVSPKWFR